jgi:hypothetical protein
MGPQQTIAKMYFCAEVAITTDNVQRKKANPTTAI